MSNSRIAWLVGWACLLLAAGARDARAAEEKNSWVGLVPGPRMPLPYDVSAYERWPELLAAVDRTWTLDEAKAVLAERVAAEKRRRELHVHYYRIGHTMAFPLPLDKRPNEQALPQGIPGISYPWTTWLAWELEERWQTLHAGWRCLGDAEAGTLWQRELAALAHWENFKAERGAVSLATAHLAASLCVAATDAAGWDPALRQQAMQAAKFLLERDVRPWFEQTWADSRPLTPARLHNIPTIALVQSAQLARAIDHPLNATLEPRVREVVQAWWKYRTGAERHTEGTAYDGFLADAVTQWLAETPDRGTWLPLGREALCGMAREWVHLGLPGRVDLHAPLGDVEPEMPFWINVLVRVVEWYGLEEGGWVLRRFPVRRMPAATLAAILRNPEFFGRTFAPPHAGPSEQLASATLRTGWNQRSLLAAIGLPRCDMGHLHADAGHLIFGWQARFWITDPGYQQYRPGPEREYTIGPQAHNVPVIAGTPPTRRGARLVALEAQDGGRQHAAVELTACYPGLPPGASVLRNVWLIPGNDPAVVVRDSLAGLPSGVEVRTHWLGGAFLAWSFPAGWARLSDGEHALWIGTFPGQLEAAALGRHPGSRGPLALEHVATLPEGRSIRWWVFQTGRAGSWSPPQLSVEADALHCRLPGAEKPAWTVP